MPVSSLLLGIATGLFWAPCAGPILGLILTGAAIQGASASTTLLLLAYALGAATSLAAALLIGGRLFAAMKRSLGAGEWIRRGLGVLVLAGVAAIALGLDTGLLTQLVARPHQRPGTDRCWTGLGLGRKTQTRCRRGKQSAGGRRDAGAGRRGGMAELPAADAKAALRGKVVLVDFWTYSCINCLRALPYVEAWAQKYKDHGLVVIGVHAPEFAFEKDARQCQPRGA